MKHQIFAVFFLILSACSATAEKYFGHESISPTLIEPAFISGSKEEQDEIQQVLKLQKNFNVNELELASREKYLRPEILILYSDRSLTRESYPNLYRLIDRTSATSKAVNDGFKDYWKVERPYVADKRINMLITPSYGPSYPSGHTTGSMVNAQILGLLIPQRSQDLQKLAKKIAARRVLVGMHYPHDIIAGEQLSRLVLGGLMQNKDFKNDFEKARKELEIKPLKLTVAKPATNTLTEEQPSVATNNDTLPVKQ
jgi:acid phosphatase (class A)